MSFMGCRQVLSPASHRHILNLGLCGGGRAVDSGKRGDFGVKMLNLGNITGDRWAKKDIHGEF